MAQEKKKSGTKKSTDLSDIILQKIKVGAPKKKDSGSLEITQSRDSILSKVDYVLTTGIDPFDDYTGAFPFGRICEIYGPESCGKTQMVIRAAVRAKTFKICKVERDGDARVLVPIDPKKAYVYVLYVDNEQSIGEDEQIVVDGVHMDVNLMRCDTIDMLFKAADIAVTEVAKAQVEDPDTLYFVVIVVDTIASTSTRGEMTQEWGKEDFSRHAKSYRQAFRIMSRKLQRGRVCMLCTNQVGDDFKAQAAKGKMKTHGLQPEDFTTFGGKAIKYYASNRIFMQKIRDYKINPKRREPSGLLIGFKMAKSRVMKPGREARMVLLFGDENKVGGGFSNEFSILETLIYLKYAEVGEGETKEIKFKFKKHGVPTKTFGDSTTTSLDEDDDEKESSRRGKKDPSIPTRQYWLSFYAAHKEDVTALYMAAINSTFAGDPVLDENSVGHSVDDDDDSDDDSDDDET